MIIYTHFLLFFLLISIVHPQPSGAPSNTPVCGGFGADCSCSHNMNAFLQLCGLPQTATCSKHIWTYSGDLDIGDQSWNILSDTVVIIGNFTAGPSSTVSVSLSPTDTSQSGLWRVSGQLSSGGNIYYNLLVAPDGTYTIPIVQYASNDQSSQFQPNVPTLPPGFTICRMFSPDSSVTYTPTAYSLIIHIVDNPTYSCTDGRGSRTWTIAFMVLLSLHAVCLLVFCLVTCKKESLKEKVWDS